MKSPCLRASCTSSRQIWSSWEVATQVKTNGKFLPCQASWDWELPSFPSVRLSQIWFHGAIYKYHLSPSPPFALMQPHISALITPRSWHQIVTVVILSPRQTMLDPMWSKQIYFCFHLTKECAASTSQDSFHGIWQSWISEFGAVSVMVFCFLLHQHPSHWSVAETPASTDCFFQCKIVYTVKCMWPITFHTDAALFQLVFIMMLMISFPLPYSSSLTVWFLTCSGSSSPHGVMLP